MSGISVRIATATDVDTIVLLNQRLIQADAGQRDPATNLEWSANSGREYFTDLLQQEGVHTLIAEDGQDAVGYLLGYLTKPNGLRMVKLAVIHSIFVQADLRSTGVGTGLVERFKEWCRGEGVERISVTAFASNEGAVLFYQRHGFEPRDVTLEVPL